MTDMQHIYMFVKISTWKEEILHTIKTYQE
jgi:hypothetical protein